jgi:hypothetical protein
MEFLDRRLDLIDKRCNGEYAWPKDKPFVAHKPVVSAALPRWIARLADLLVVVVLGLIAGGFYWLLR